jgi:hypothetical protein
MTKHFILLFIFVLLSSGLFSQGSFVPLNKDYHHLIERYEIKSGTFPAGIHTSVKPYLRKSVAEFVDGLMENQYLKLSDADKFNLYYLSIDNWEWSKNEFHLTDKAFLKYFYKSKSDFYHVDEDEFDLHVNPVFHFNYGTETASDLRPFINTRGAEIRGMINRKVGFYTYIGENQALYPQHSRDYIKENGVVPGEGFWKSFKKNGVDFLEARGYVNVNATKNIGIMFGHDRHIIGNGYRSMILSDFSNNYLFMKVNTQIWKFNYTNLFTQLYADQNFGATGSRQGPYPKKYLALHHLSLNILKNLNIGLFEGLVFGNDQQSGFNINYLNPIIFYRYIEHQSGSEDNAIVGADFKWNFLKQFSFYGQFVLDEFVLSHLKAQNGWWANKYAGQLGLKYIDAFSVKNLDFQGEANFARPFIYTHFDIYSNYAHYRMPLAHPLGANFTEMVGIMRYQPMSRLNIVAKLIRANYGEDETGKNYGGHIMNDYRSRTLDFGNEIGQGVATNLTMADLTATFQVRHNLFLDLRHIYRKVDSERSERDRNNNYTGVSFRMNIAKTEHSF